jgi:transposase InsO family protein
LVARIQALSERYPRFGYRKLFALLKGEQWAGSRETGRRLRQREGLQGVTNARQRRPLGQRTTVPPRALYPNHVWSDDCVHEETTDGRRLKCLPGLDAYTREALTIACARSLTAGDGVHGLLRLFAQRGAPADVHRDNGPEFMAQQGTTWLRAPHVDPHFIAPGRPWQHGHHESLNGVLRDGCRHRWRFASVQEARRIINNWREEYHYERPHGALDGLTPKAFATQCRGPSPQAACVCLTLTLVALSWA